MAYTIPPDSAPVVVTLATTCTLVTQDGSDDAQRALWAYISSDTTGSSDVVRIVYSDSLADGGALPASGYHEIPCSQLPTLVPLHRRRMLLQGSSAFAVSVDLRG